MTANSSPQGASAEPRPRDEKAEFQTFTQWWHSIVAVEPQAAAWAAWMARARMGVEPPGERPMKLKASFQQMMMDAATLYCEYETFRWVCGEDLPPELAAELTRRINSFEPGVGDQGERPMKPHPSDHAYVPDSVESDMCGVCGWCKPEKDGEG